MSKRLILHWVDQEVGATRAFCGQQGGVLLTHLKEAATCSNCVKKLTFLKRVRAAHGVSLALIRKWDESNLVSIESHKKGD